MGQRNSIKLILILVLLVASIWIDLPGNPGIKIGEFERSLETQLGLDLRGGLRVLLEADLPEETQVSSEEMEDAKTILEILVLYRYFYYLCRNFLHCVTDRYFVTFRVIHFTSMVPT